MTTAVFKCPGHVEFFHRYRGREKAKRKASEEVSKLEKNENILNAKYNIISANSPEGKESVYFKRLNKLFFNHAVELLYTHKDNCKECSFFATNETAKKKG